MTFPHADGNGRPSHWLATTPLTSYPPVPGDLRADVVVVGGGIVGITAAYLLSKAGKSVVVVDRERLATAETGHTTGHLQNVDDTRLKDLVDRFGFDRAKLVWDGHGEAIRLIESICADERIRCDLERLDAYLFSPNAADASTLQEELRLARDMGYDAQFASPDAVPFPTATAVRFPNQGKFHVRKYLLGVVAAAERYGVRFFEGTECVDVEDGPPTKVKTRDGHTLTCDFVVHATNVPFTTRGRMDTKLFPYRTYAVAAKVPKGVFRHALYWDTLDPYHYLRNEGGNGFDLVILGGEDHGVGEERDTDVHYANLEAFLRTATPDVEVVERWSGEVIETEDDLPFIGSLPGRPDNEFVVTGDSGTGMTHGTLGAMMVTERILGRGTPWDGPYDAGRVSLEKTSVKQWIEENASAAVGLVKTVTKASEVADPGALAPGEGAVLRHGLKHFAVSRDTSGAFECVSAKCTHMGCSVAWNASEGSWDCPCHGSRFARNGDVLHGPAKDPLEPATAEEMEALGLKATRESHAPRRG